MGKKGENEFDRRHGEDRKLLSSLNETRKGRVKELMRL